MKVVSHIIGSSADDSFGVGTLLIGTDYHRSEEGWVLHTTSGLVDVYDVMIVYTDGTTHSPEEIA